MGNCLVTKLKGVVDNENLPKLDEFIINLNVTRQGGVQYNNVFGISPFIGDDYTKEKVIVTGGHNAYSYNTTSMEADQNLGSEITASSPSGISICFPEVGEYAIKVTPKYKFYNLSFPEFAVFDVGELKYSKSYAFNANNCRSLTGNLDEFLINSKDILLTLYLTSCEHLEFNVENLLNITNLATLYLNSVGAKGDFESLGTIYGNIQSFRISGTQVVGSIEGFVRNAVAAGVTTKSTNFEWLGSNIGITYNGAAITNQESNPISWEPYGNNQTKITLNGVEVIINN